MAREIEMDFPLFRNPGTGGYKIAAIDTAGEKVTTPKASHWIISSSTPTQLVE